MITFSVSEKKSEPSRKKSFLSLKDCDPFRFVSFLEYRNSSKTRKKNIFSIWIWAVLKIYCVRTTNFASKVVFAFEKVLEYFS